MIKVLVVNTVPTDRNGVTNVIFNYYRAIDKRVLIIDCVAINTPSEEYRKILVQLGSGVQVDVRTAQLFVREYTLVA